jgi:hypothetical protein
MKIEKAHFNVDGDNVRITMPLQKVDKKRRIVSGFATMDAPDTQDDIVTKDASKRAFADFRGNLRLMHQPIPAGKLVNAREDTFFDKKSGKLYNGIYVDAYVSEGAEDIWKMVLDGTLTGFSIGGSVKKARNDFDKASGKSYRYIDEYTMTELSLVDSPANQLCNVVSIQKSADGTKVEGMVADTQIENVFYCKKDHEPVAIVAAEEKKTCVECDSEMKNIGWFEADGGDKSEKVNALITKFESSEGGDKMADEENDKQVENLSVEEKAEEQATTVESAEEVSPKDDDEAVAPEEESKESETATNVVDENVTVTGTGAVKVEEAKEVVQPEFEDGKTVPGGEAVTKLLGELTKTIHDEMEKGRTQNAQALAEFQVGFEKKLNDLGDKHTELSERLSALTEKFAGVEKRFDGLEGLGAVKKSADLGGDAEDSSIQKNHGKQFWGGVFSVGNLG